MAAVRPADDFPDASDMLAEALKQMDGLLAGEWKTKVSKLTMKQVQCDFAFERALFMRYGCVAP